MPDHSRHALLLEGISLVPLMHLLPKLYAGLGAAGVWTDTPHPASSSASSLRLESPLDAIPALYTALVRSGLRLAVPAHVALASLCSESSQSLYSGGSTSTGIRELQLNIRSVPTELYLDSERDAISA